MKPVSAPRNGSPVVTGATPTSEPEAKLGTALEVELLAALKTCESVLNANLATPETDYGRRAMAAVNVARPAILNAERAFATIHREPVAVEIQGGQDGEVQVAGGDHPVVDLGSVSFGTGSLGGHESNVPGEMLQALERLANIADTAASLLHKSAPEEAELFRQDGLIAREAIQKARTAGIVAPKLLCEELTAGTAFAPPHSMEYTTPVGKTTLELGSMLKVVFDEYRDYHDPAYGSGRFEDMVLKFASDSFFKDHFVAQAYLELMGVPAPLVRPLTTRHDLAYVLSPDWGDMRPLVSWGLVEKLAHDAFLAHRLHGKAVELGVVRADDVAVAPESSVAEVDVVRAYESPVVIERHLFSRLSHDAALAVRLYADLANKADASVLSGESNG